MPENSINVRPAIGGVLENVLRFTSAFKGDTRGEIATVLLRGEMTKKEMGRKLRVSRDRLSKHLTEMVDDGVVTARCKGNHQYFQLVLGDDYYSTMKFLSMIANPQAQNSESPNAEASEARLTPLASEESESPFPELLEVADMTSASPEEREIVNELYAYCTDMIYFQQKSLWKDQRNFQLDICLSWLRILKGSREKSKKALLLHLKRSGFVVINMRSSITHTPSAA